MGAMRRSSAAHGIVACAAILQLSAVLAPATGHSLSPRAPAGTEAGQPFIPARRSILVSDQRKSLRYTQPGLNEQTQHRERRQLNRFVIEWIGLANAQHVQAAAEAAFMAAESLLGAGPPIRVRFAWEPLSPGVLGSSAPLLLRDFSGAPRSATYYPAALVNQLCNGCVSASSGAHMFISLNSEYDGWYIGTDAGVGSEQQDLVTVTLHEIAHGIGISHSFAGSGAVGYMSGESRYPSIFDTLVRQGAAGHYIYTHPAADVAAALVSGDLWLSAMGSHAQLYSPATFSAANSVSHLDSATYTTGPEVLMRPSIPRGTAIHYFGGAVSCVIGALGWTGVGCNVQPAPSPPPPPTTAVHGTSALANEAGYEFIYRINCGGPTVSDTAGNLWVSDTAFSPGGFSISPGNYVEVNLPNVPDTTQYSNLWISERWTRFGNADLVYELPVSQAGTYRVTFLFGEMWHHNPGTRVFSVEVQGALAFGDLDVVASAGFQTPLILETLVEVTTAASVQVRFVSHQSSQEGPAIYALALARATTTSAPVPGAPPPSFSPTAQLTASPTYPPDPEGLQYIHRINCGGPTVVDGHGNAWRSDSFYNPGGSTIAPGSFISVNLPAGGPAAEFAQLWATERWVRWDGHLEYFLSVPEPGTYHLTLLFIEMWHTAIGTRVFSVEVQGRAEIVSLDVFSEVGRQVPLIRELVVQVLPGQVADGVRVRFVSHEDVNEGPAIYGMSLAKSTVVATASPTTAAPVAPTTPITLAPTSPTLPPTSPAPTTQAPTPVSVQVVTFVELTPRGCCRTIGDTSGNQGAPYATANVQQCEDECAADVLCTGIEWHDWESKCEKHFSVNDFHHTAPNQDCWCRRKDVSVVPYTAPPSTLGPTSTAPSAAPTATAAPTSAAPTTEAPTTAAPVTSAPTTAAPTSAAPTTEHPTVAVTPHPSTVAPTTETPTTAAPTTAAPTTLSPTTEAPTTEAQAPTTEAPTTAAPTTPSPTSNAPTTEHPTVAGTPEPTTFAPTTETPTTPAPTTLAPTTLAPSTAEPTTESPTTDAPTVPATGAPVTATPTSGPPTAFPTSAPPTAAPTDGYEEVVSYFELEPRGCCRTPEGGYGAEVEPFLVSSYLACQAACTVDPLCTGVEWHDWDYKCEKHLSERDFDHTAQNDDCWCMQKVITVVPVTQSPTTPQPSSSAPTTEAPTAAPTSLAPTTAAPTSASPTSAQPTSAAPTTAHPTVPPASPTAIPTTGIPTTASPTSLAPTTASPTTAAPTSVAPSTPAPTNEYAYSEVDHPGRGCCRTAANGVGAQGTPFEASLDECQASCSRNPVCFGVEYHLWNNKCELHFSADDFHHSSDYSLCQCFEKVEATASPTSTPPTSASPTSPTLAPTSSSPTTAAPTTAAPTYDGLTSALWRDNGPSLPLPIGEVASAVVGDKLYAFGEGQPHTFVYDVLARTWTANEPIRPHVGDHHGIAAVGTTIFLIGGFNYPCVISSCRGQAQKYDTVSKVWTSLGSLPYHVEGSPITAYLNNHIHVCSGLFHRTADGGYAGYSGPAGTNPTDCFKLHPTTGAWTRFTSIPHGVDHAAVATDGVRLFVGGGRNIGRNVAEEGIDLLQIYDSASGQWSIGNPLPVARGGAGGAFVAGIFFVMGGETDPYAPDPNTVPGRGVYPHVHMYNPITGVWSRGPDMPVAVHGISPAFHASTQSLLVAGGGVVAANSASSHLQVLSVNGPTPAPTTAAPTTTPTETPTPSPTAPTPGLSFCPAPTQPATTRGIPSTVSWQPGVEQELDIREAMGLVHAGRLWVVGGFESLARAPLSEGWRWHWQGLKLFSYNPTTNVWAQHRSLDRITGGLSHSGQIVADNKLVVAGGMYMTEQETWPNVNTIAGVYAYDFQRDNWEDYPPLPAARAGGPLVTLGRRLHFFGGGRVVPNDIFVEDFTDHWALNLDDISAGWQTLAPLRHARNHMAGVVHRDKIYALGGQLLEDEHHSNVAYVEVYDPCTDVWTDLPPMPAARGHIQQSVFSIPEGIFVAGGTENFPRRHDPSLLFYQPEHNRWTNLPVKPIGGASQVTGIVDTGAADGSVKILQQRHNASWIASVYWTS